MKCWRSIIATLSMALVAVTLPGHRVAAADWSRPDQTYLPGFSHIVVDNVHDRVFVSGGRADEITVTDAAGVVIKTISGLADPEGEALSPDSSMLYVALRDSGTIAAVDTTDLSMTKIELGGGVCPETLAVVASMLWYGYGCRAFEGDIGAIDLVTGQVYPDLAGGIQIDAAPTLASDQHALPAKLFAAERDSDSAQLWMFQATGGTTPKLTVAAHTVLDGPPLQMAVTPDGTGLVVAAAYARRHDVLSTTDLSVVGSYATGHNPFAVAIRSDGLVAAGDYAASGRDIFVYRPGQPARLRFFAFDEFDTLRPAGLAFGDTSLYAVSGLQGRHPFLHVLDPRRRTGLTIAAGQRSYAYGATAVVSAHLGTTDTNRFVSIYVTPYEGTPRLLKRARVDATGTLLAHARVFKRTTFTATFAGDADSLPARATVVVGVHARVTNALRHYYARSGIYHLYHVGTDPALVATVAPNEAGECLYFRAQQQIGGAWRALESSSCVTLDPHSRAAAYLGPPHTAGEHVRLRAEWRTHDGSAVSFGTWQYARFTP
jgi:DNA-binding beta-propeller fold protein YncE